MQTREALLASLIAVADEGAVTFADGSYVDFSQVEGDGRAFEIGNQDGEAVQLTLSRAEMLALHSALTRALLG